jgi:hypothetical protein
MLQFAYVWSRYRQSIGRVLALVQCGSFVFEWIHVLLCSALDLTLKALCPIVYFLA